jgi:hypothetical protein
MTKYTVQKQPQIPDYETGTLRNLDPSRITEMRGGDGSVLLIATGISMETIDALIDVLDEQLAALLNGDFDK